MKHIDQLKSSNIIWTGAIAGLVLLLLLLVLQLFHYRQEASDVAFEQGNSAATRALELMKAEQLSSLSETRWLDREAGVAAIPIEDAMARIVQTQGGAEH